ncbi:MAG: hypothetical protein KDI09_13820 [Halioglobus sp.]|nr:hypothetical protein [Halioglobus sp.]
MPREYSPWAAYRGALRAGVAGACLFLLVACAGRATPYSPGPDPLVQAYLERALVAERIAYKRGYTGEYLAMNPSKQSRLEALGEEARAVPMVRERIAPVDTCATDRLRAYLKSADALFVITALPEGGELQMSEASYRALDVAARYQGFVSECGAR